MTDFVYARGHRDGYRQALEDVAEWLERTSGGGHPIALYWRVEMALDLRDGTWRHAKPLKGLRERDLMQRRAGALSRRGVPVVDMPEDIRAWIDAERARRATARGNRNAEVARILADEYGLDAPARNTKDGGP